MFWLPFSYYLSKGKGTPSRWFQTKLNTSGRTAVVIMPPVFAFGLYSEQAASRLGNPTRLKIEEESLQGHIPIYKSLLNFILDQPAQFFIIGATPVGLATYLSSTRVVTPKPHNRFGAAVVGGIGVVTVAIHGFMQHRGRF